MEKTLVRFFGGAAMVCGALLGLPASAHAQSVQFVLSADTSSGSARQTLPQVVHITNYGAEATGVTLTFTPPKGAKVDSTCQVDHLPGGVRTYICSVGTVATGQTVDVTFSISMIKAGDASFSVEVTCDQGDSDSIQLPISFS
jgi:uncharacterized protein DUF11